MRTAARKYAGFRKFRRAAGKVLIAAGIIMMITVTVFDICIRPSLQKMLDYKCRTEAENVISEAIYGSIGNELQSYSDIVTFTYDSSGRITSLQTNQSRINSLKALLNETVNNGIDNMTDHKVGISIGTLTGISFLYGRGYTLEFNVEPQGKADTRLISTFRDSGINQTMHSIILEVSVTISPMLIGFGQDIEVVSDFIITQTVLIGDVPQSYSNIVLGEEYYSELANIDI